MKRMLYMALLWALTLPSPAVGLDDVAARPAPPLVVPLVAGGKVNLAQLRGRVVLVNYWASWCPPCLMEMPSMNRLAGIMRRTPFVLLAVNAGESPAWVRGFAAQTRPHFYIALDEGSRNMHNWGGFVVPSSFLIDKWGRIRYAQAGPAQWDSPEMVATISKLLAE